MGRSFCAWLLVAAVALSQWSCSDDDNGDGPLPACEGFEIVKGSGKGTKTARIGLLSPITGESKAAGAKIRNSALMAFEDIDFQVGDYNLEVVLIDSAGDASGSGVAKKNYEKAVANCGLSMGLINWHSAVAVDCMDVALANKLPHLFAYGASDAVNQKYDRDNNTYWATKAWPEPGVYVQSYLDALQAAIEGDASTIELEGQPWAPAHKKILLGNEAGAWGKSFIRGARKQLTDSTKWWKKNGWEIVDTVNTDDETQFASIIADVKAKNISLILFTTTKENIAEFVKLANKEIPEVMVIIEGLGWSPALTNSGAAAARVIDGGGASFQDNDLAKDYKKRYKDKYGEDAQASNGGLAVDYGNFAVKVLKRVWEKHKKLDKDSIQDVNVNELQKGKITYGPGAVNKMYKYTDKTVPDMEYGLDFYYFPIVQYQDDGTGTIVTKKVFPKDIADGKFQTPPATP